MFEKIPKQVVGYRSMMLKYKTNKQEKQKTNNKAERKLSDPVSLISRHSENLRHDSNVFTSIYKQKLTKIVKAIKHVFASEILKKI